jgi:uncharacterized protein (DUF433 family)
VSARAIVRDPDILDGRWHFEGTSTAVANVRTDYDAEPTGAGQSYRFAGLSDEEIEAALAFGFPAVNDVAVAVALEYGSVTVACVCAEHTRKTGVWPLVAEVECPCRRTWRITVEPVSRVDAQSKH